MNSRVKEFGLLVLLAALWGPSFLFIKIAVAEISPMLLAGLRIGLAAVFLNVFLLLRSNYLSTDKTFWKHVAISGFFAQGLPFILINWGEQHIGSGLASILNGLTPLSTVLLAHLAIDSERLSLQKLTGIIFGFFGLIVLSYTSLSDGFDSSILGILAVTMGAMSYGAGIVYARLYLKGTKPMHAPAGQLLSTAIYILPLGLLLDSTTTLTSLSNEAITSVLILAFFGTTVAFVVYFNLLERTSASFVSLVTYLMPIFGIILGVVFLNEVVSLSTFAGLLLIFMGVVISDNRLSKYFKKSEERPVVCTTEELVAK